ncbi:integrase [Lysinibacillus sp. ACHW1.5]|uniref:integrase n=1 Tax=Lysinibacillus sp. ACHW1.5 TaxID=2913506 RepID=UPI001EDAB51F|nr:integrase [Lysinibacillus sp. ACHW1.5]UKJ43440.1 integrase [Lysinibacillus sp. ACHW1.5]
MAEFMTGEIPLNFKTNPYKRVKWEDDLTDPNTGEVLEEGTIFWAEYGNNLEWGLYNAYRFLIEQARQMQRMQIQMELDGRVPGNSGTFADPLDGSSNKIKLDTALTDVIEPVAISTTTLKVASVDGFTPFTQVTIFDDVAKEDVVITEVGTNTIKVQALKNAYKKGAKVARTNVLIDTVNTEMGVGNWQTYRLEIVEVV